MLVKSIYKEHKKNNEFLSCECDDRDIFNPAKPPTCSLNKCKMGPREAFQVVNSEDYFDANPQLNLATFVTTWMEPEAIEIMRETMDKNYIDKLIYPQTIEVEKRCVSILANLYNAKEWDDPAGTSTIGSTEASLLAGLNYKTKWKKWAKGRVEGEPEIILGSNVQVCWLKFAKYFEVKPIIVPIGSDNKIDINEVGKKLSPRTICVVGIFGNTFTGEFDDIEGLNYLVDKYNKAHNLSIPIHVDAASGGFIAPFYKEYKDIPWDFRLKWVKSINISGHKYGGVFAGLGWALWRDKEDIDEELIFKINYLGGEQEDFSLNFSKSAANVIAQYYNLTRLGREGYEELTEYLFEIQSYLTKKFKVIRFDGKPIFKIVNKYPGIPMIAMALTDEGKELGLDLPSFATKMKQYGWSIPAYSMPEPYEDETIIRFVLRVGTNYVIADRLYKDSVSCLEALVNKDTDNTKIMGNGANGVC